MEGEGERGWLARVREFECTALGALQVCVFCESRAVSERERRGCEEGEPRECDVLPTGSGK